jgi:DNA-directed RNA polymerase specialized sigma24 family protein
MGVSVLRRGRRPVTLTELEAVYSRDAAAFKQVAGAIVGDGKSGCDAVQDAFVQALRHRDRFRADASVEAALWRFVIGEARKRRARIVRGAQAGRGMGAVDPPARSTPEETVPPDVQPMGWVSVIDAAETANRKRWRWLVRAVSVASLAVAAGAMALAWPFGKPSPRNSPSARGRDARRRPRPALRHS